MLIGPIEPRDRDRVAEIARLGGQELDVDGEGARAWARIWVARKSEDSDALGFLLAWSVADELHVINVATHPDRRRQGIASSLIKHVLEQAVRAQTRLVLLEVRRSNRAAILLYRAHGLGVRRAYYADNSEDAIEMMLAIDPVTGTILPGHDEIPILETPPSGDTQGS
jgi:ribosomal-protein-alanine N-acetyltransferase